MNGYSLLNEAARLNGLDAADEKLKIIGLTLVNSALADMELPQISSLSQAVKTLGVKEAEAVRFCLAALVSNALGDSLSAENMSKIYREKKSAAKDKICRVRDTLPRGEW